jgi:hypothetical protein
MVARFAHVPFGPDLNPARNPAEMAGSVLTVTDVPNAVREVIDVDPAAML